jgi:hypothetical protein
MFCWPCIATYECSNKIHCLLSIGIFHWLDPSGRTMTLGLTHPLTEMSNRNISNGVKTAGAWGWQPYHLHVPIILKSVSLNLQEPSGPVQACEGIAFALLWLIVCTCYEHLFSYHQEALYIQQPVLFCELFRPDASRKIYQLFYIHFLLMMSK